MIRLTGIKKHFKLYPRPLARLLELCFLGKRHRLFEALKGVDLHVGAGETLGIIGRNGAGKSTLLKILVGILFPDEGTLEVKGRVVGLMELGTGFNPEFSGFENIAFNAMLLGMDDSFVREKREEIIAFSELAPFIHEPIKSYSSGMVMRLAFSIAVHTEPDCFIVDEALSVGDAFYSQKCYAKLAEHRARGGALIFVSHDLNAVRTLCDRTMVMHAGQTIFEGDTEDAVNFYNYQVAIKEDFVAGQDEGGMAAQGYGNRAAVMVNAFVENDQGEASSMARTAAPCALVVDVAAQEDVGDLTVGFCLRNRYSQDIFGTNSHHMGERYALSKGQSARIRFDFPSFDVAPGEYVISLSLHAGRDHQGQCYHWLDRALALSVSPGKHPEFVGYSYLHPRLSKQTLPS